MLSPSQILILPHFYRNNLGIVRFINLKMFEIMLVLNLIVLNVQFSFEYFGIDKI